mmetsp:Transcript_2397/g.5470  ORF Transcript_2397/g.5470 Transcript_2397/m.5470 type:complete len:772 (+) Transcript_2397:133-2448(+)
MSVPTAAAEFAQEIWAADDFVAKARERVEHSLDKPDSGLDKSKIRSIYWKVFLGCVDRKDKSIWKNQVEAQRNEYQEYLKDMTADPASKKDMDLDLNNPLSQGNDNPWTQYYENMELCKVIQLDLDRTHPGSAFFQDKKIQKQMLNILFVWSKMNPDYSYRQGMNELLSPILLTLSNDADKAANESPPNSSGESGEVFRLLMSKKFIEHDSFVVFNKLMSHMRQYFAVVKPTSPQRQSRLVSKPFVPQQTPIVTKCENLQQKILKSVDKVLHRHLEDEDVQPTLYLLRWVRLLFAREFHILDVQLIWDHVFALATYSPRKELELPLMDYFCVAMCLYVRADLLRGDNSTCLRRLLSFPPVGQMATLVQRAVQLMRGKHLRSVKPAAPRSTKGGKAAIRGIRGGQTPTKRAVDQRFTGKGIAASVGGNVRNILNYVPSIGAAVAGGSGGKDQAREAEVKALKTRMAEMEKKKRIAKSLDGLTVRRLFRKGETEFFMFWRTMESVSKRILTVTQRINCDVEIPSVHDISQMQCKSPKRNMNLIIVVAPKNKLMSLKEEKVMADGDEVVSPDFWIGKHRFHMIFQRAETKYIPIYLRCKSGEVSIGAFKGAYFRATPLMLGKTGMNSTIDLYWPPNPGGDSRFESKGTHFGESDVSNYQRCIGVVRTNMVDKWLTLKHVREFLKQQGADVHNLEEKVCGFDSDEEVLPIVLCMNEISSIKTPKDYERCEIHQRHCRFTEEAGNYFKNIGFKTLFNPFVSLEKPFRVLSCGGIED